MECKTKKEYSISYENLAEVLNIKGKISLIYSHLSKKKLIIEVEE